jgi:hypothetical protein
MGAVLVSPLGGCMTHAFDAEATCDRADQTPPERELEIDQHAKREA